MTAALTFAATLNDLLRLHPEMRKAEILDLAGDDAEGNPFDAAYFERLRRGLKENPSATTCERLGFAIGSRSGYDAMVEATNRLLEAAGYAPLHIQRRRRRQKPRR